MILETTYPATFSFFKNIDAFSSQSETEFHFVAAFIEHQEYAIKMLYNLRDRYSQGKGLRDQFRYCIQWLIIHYPTNVIDMIKSGIFEKYGYWRDYFTIFSGTSLESNMIQHYCVQLSIDSLNNSHIIENPDSPMCKLIQISNAAKWAPNEKSSLDKKYGLAKKLAVEMSRITMGYIPDTPAKLTLIKKLYRKTLVNLRIAIKIQLNKHMQNKTIRKSHLMELLQFSRNSSGFRNTNFQELYDMYNRNPKSCFIFDMESLNYDDVYRVSSRFSDLYYYKGYLTNKILDVRDIMDSDAPQKGYFDIFEMHKTIIGNLEIVNDPIPENVIIITDKRNLHLNNNPRYQSETTMNSTIKRFYGKTYYNKASNRKTKYSILNVTTRTIVKAPIHDLLTINVNAVLIDFRYSL